MDWYKQSRLIDKKTENQTVDINTQCMYCSRWETHPYNQKAHRNETIWKIYDQLDSEEKIEVDKNTNMVSHGICKHCMDILEEVRNTGKDLFKMTPKEIRELSLKNELV